MQLPASASVNLQVDVPKESIAQNPKKACFTGKPNQLGRSSSCGQAATEEEGRRPVGGQLVVDVSHHDLPLLHQVVALVLQQQQQLLQGFDFAIVAPQRGPVEEGVLEAVHRGGGPGGGDSCSESGHGSARAGGRAGDASRGGGEGGNV
ncbi:hypothetical protein TYRP_022212 [Tyrophagus putrescentiae]|nr:hypothetical protein TYRP_022212 [Tyrophagus putrescentiae]